VKKLFIILSLILFSCSSPEQKIIQSFKNDRPHHSRIKITGASIYDTLYLNDVLDSISFYENKTRYIRQQLDGVNSFRDSVIKLNYSDSTRRLIFRKYFDNIRRLERELDRTSHKQMIRYSFYNTHDSICGYLVKIYAERDTFDFVVMSNYNILCPTFVFY